MSLTVVKDSLISKSRTLCSINLSKEQCFACPLSSHEVEESFSNYVLLLWLDTLLAPCLISTSISSPKLVIFIFPVLLAYKHCSGIIIKS